MKLNFTINYEILESRCNVSAYRRVTYRVKVEEFISERINKIVHLIIIKYLLYRIE